MIKQKDSYTLIRNSAQRIGKRLRPEKIILFGSHAQGTPHVDSDVDLLLVFEDKKNIAGRYREASRILEPRLFPVDVLIRSSREVRDRLKIGDHFMREIIEKGKILYES